MTVEETYQLLRDIGLLWYGKTKYGADVAEVGTVWARVLQGIPFSKVEEAVNGIVRQGSPFPPTVAEIIGRVRQDMLDDCPDAESVWREVVKAVTLYGRNRLPEARNTMAQEVMDVIETIGGWTAVCNGEMHDKFVHEWEEHCKRKVDKLIDGKGGKHNVA